MKTTRQQAALKQVGRIIVIAALPVAMIASISSASRSSALLSAALVFVVAMVAGLAFQYAAKNNAAE